MNLPSLGLEISERRLPGAVCAGAAEVYPTRSFAFLRKLIPAEFIACQSLQLEENSLDIAFDTEHRGLTRRWKTLSG